MSEQPGIRSGISMDITIGKFYLQSYVLLSHDQSCSRSYLSCLENRSNLTVKPGESHILSAYLMWEKEVQA